jgi:hypothetical protein
MQTGLK